MNEMLMRKLLARFEANSVLTDLSESLVSELPQGVSFEENKWDVISWIKRIGYKNSENLIFTNIPTNDAREIAKIWILHGRLTSSIGVSAARSRLNAVAALSEQLGKRDIRSITTSDFYDAQRRLLENYSIGTAYRQSGSLGMLSAWLGSVFGKPLDYVSSITSPAVHGRRGTEEGREQKRIPDQVIGDLLAARGRKNLLLKDAYFIDLTMIEVGTGFRIAELMLLPEDCKRKENGRLQILHYPEKHSDPVPRPVADKLATAVESAIDSLKNISNQAKSILENLVSSEALDWRRILRDENATRYFVSTWVCEWTRLDMNMLYSPKGAWWNAGGRWVDAVAELDIAKGNKSEAARNIGMNRKAFYDVLGEQQASLRGERPLYGRLEIGKNGLRNQRINADARIVSVNKFNQALGLNSSAFRCGNIAESIIHLAADMQITGRDVPIPVRNEALENEFRRMPRVLLRTAEGKTIQTEANALLLVPFEYMSPNRRTKSVDVKWVSWSDYSNWLSGLSRASGTKNFEDSVFSRLGIVDQRTGEVAKFTTHDVRHWLNSLYQDGGLTDDQISIIFNRKHVKDTPTYDQTPLATRVQRLKEAVRDSLVIGGVSEIYQSLVADYSREDAERYLDSAIRMVNPMPHGVCTLNWASVPCPHHLSCFSREDSCGGSCEHLIVDLNNADQRKEVQRLSDTADRMIEALEAQGLVDSPSADHSRRISANTKRELHLAKEISKPDSRKPDVKREQSE